MTRVSRILKGKAKAWLAMNNVFADDVFTAYWIMVDILYLGYDLCWS